MGQRGEVFSSKFGNKKRTYFFNVKENRTGDLYLNIVESKKNEDDTVFERHSVIIFGEDLDGVMESMEEAVKFMRANRKRNSSSRSGTDRTYG